MKYSIHHLLALMLLVALAVQAWHARKIGKHIELLEHAYEGAQKRLRKEESQRFQYELCKQVVDAYEYPSDYAAAKGRFARLETGQRENDQRHE